MNKSFDRAETEKTKKCCTCSSSFGSAKCVVQYFMFIKPNFTHIIRMVFDEPAPFRQPVIQTIRFPDFMNL